MASLTRTVCVQSGVVCQASADPGDHLRKGSARTISPKATTPSSARLKGVNFIGKAHEKRRSGARRSVITNQAAKAILAGRATAMVNHYSGARVFHGYLDFLKRE